MREDIAVIALANRVLDRPNADPDDDLAMLARQLLRRQERVESLEAKLAIAFDALREYAGIDGEVAAQALAKIKP